MKKHPLATSFKNPYAKQVTAVEKLLLDEWNSREPAEPNRVREVQIVTWEHELAGLRVAEVTFITRPQFVRHPHSMIGTSGSSFMQSDTEAVPFLTERLILELKHKDLGPDDTEMYWGKLKEACFGTDTEAPVAT